MFLGSATVLKDHTKQYESEPSRHKIFGAKAEVKIPNSLSALVQKLN